MKREGKKAHGRVVLTDEMLRWVGFVSGAIAGISRVMVGHPFDTLKVRLQTGGTLLPETSLRGLSSLYRGILPPLFSVGFSTSTNFGIYENTRLSLLHRREPTTIWGHVALEFIAGTVAGSVMALALIPLENAKVIQQTSSESRGTVGWLRTLYSRRGIKAWYRGVVPHLFQAGAGRGFYLSAYFIVKAAEDGKILKDTIPQRFRDNLSSSTVHGKIAAAACAGIAGWSFTYPFDVTRSNMMRDWRLEHHKTTYGCMRSLVQKGGIAQLYAGFGFTLLRSIPVACVALPSYDISRRWMLRALSDDANHC